MICKFLPFLHNLFQSWLRSSFLLHYINPRYSSVWTASSSGLSSGNAEDLQRWHLWRDTGSIDWSFSLFLSVSPRPFPPTCCPVCPLTIPHNMTLYKLRYAQPTNYNDAHIYSCYSVANIALCLCVAVDGVAVLYAVPVISSSLQSAAQR